MQRLLEFQRYKEAAGILHQKAQIRAATWTRPDTVLPAFDDAGEEMLEAGLFDLISAFKELLDRRKTLLAHEVESEGKSVEQRMEELLALLREGESLEFLELFAAQETKADMIVTFLALLELIRLKRVKVYQRGIFGAIRVFRPVGPRGGRGCHDLDRNDETTTTDETRQTDEPRGADDGRHAERAAETRRADEAARPAAGGDPRGARGADLRLAAARSRRARSARSWAACRKEAWQAALEELQRRLRARRPRPAARRGRGRLPDHHPPRVQRLGPRAARPAGRPRGCPSRPWRRWPSSPTSSR